MRASLAPAVVTTGYADMRGDTIDSRTNPEGLKFYSYCGSAMNMDALVRVQEVSWKC